VQASHCRWNDIAGSGTNRKVLMTKEIRLEGAKFGRRSHFLREGPTGCVPIWDDVLKSQRSVGKCHLGVASTQYRVRSAVIRSLVVVAVIAVVACNACNACDARIARNARIAAGTEWVQRRYDVDGSQWSGGQESSVIGPECSLVIGSSLQEMMQRRGVVLGVEGVESRVLSTQD